MTKKLRDYFGEESSGKILDLAKASYTVHVLQQLQSLIVSWLMNDYDSGINTVVICQSIIFLNYFMSLVINCKLKKFHISIVFYYFAIVYVSIYTMK